MPSGSPFSASAHPGGAGTGTAFGVWLKERRKSLGLTQKDLAERVDCSAVTIEKIESGERKPSGQIAELLAGYFSVPDDERRAFVEFARSSVSAAQLALLTPIDGHSPWRTLRALTTNLPSPPTTFVGREREVDTVCTLLRTSGVRLMTLAGPPGIGKTRLSIEAAERLIPHFEDGVFFVPLASVRDPELVASCIVRSVGLQEGGQQSLLDDLKSHLRDRRTLLVLDNFEQVIAAAPQVSDLLSSAAWLKVLITSREVLRVYGEHEFLVPQLTAIDTRYLPPVERLMEYEAVRLYVERAKAVNSDFTLTDENAPAVLEICIRLDRVPLAIELAAARTSSLTPNEIVKRLDSSLEFLMGGARDLPPRQRALRSAIDWSYDLLDEGERGLFRGLSVFVGGCTLEAAEVVIGARESGASALIPVSRFPAPIEVQDGIASLLDKSLLRREHVHDEMRVSMLETVREYAWGRLVGRGEDELIWERYAAYFLDLAEQARGQMRGPEQRVWLDRLEREHDNFRAVFRGAIERGNAELALRLGAALWKFWLTHGHLTEGRGRLARALALDGTTESPVRADALNAAGNLAHLCGDIPAAQAFYEESLAIRRALDDKRGIASSLNNLALVANMQGDFARTRSLHEESLAIKTELGDSWGIASSLGNLAIAVADQGDYASAQSLHEQSLAIRRELGDKLGIGLSLRNLGTVLAARGAYEAAEASFNESLTIGTELGDRPGAAECLVGLGELEHVRGNYTKAAYFHQQSLEICRELGDQAGIANALLNLYHAARRQGRDRRAATLLRQSLAIRMPAGSRRGIIECLAALAGVALSQGRPETAAQAIGATEAHLNDSGFHLAPIDRIEYELASESTRNMLDGDTWKDALARGRGMSPEQVVALVFGKL